MNEWMNNNKKQTWNLKQEGFFMGQKNSIFNGN